MALTASSRPGPPSFASPAHTPPPKAAAGAGGVLGGGGETRAAKETKEPPVGAQRLATSRTMSGMGYLRRERVRWISKSTPSAAQAARPAPRRGFRPSAL